MIINKRSPEELKLLAEGAIQAISVLDGKSDVFPEYNLDRTPTGRMVRAYSKSPDCRETGSYPLVFYAGELSAICSDDL